jgi:hypothetical protein
MGTPTNVTYYRVKLQELLPPSDPVVPDLLRLMAAANDLRTLQNMWMLSQSRRGATSTERQLILKESIDLFRLACATTYEAGMAFQQFRKNLEKAGRQADIMKLPDRGRSAFILLENLFQQGFEQNGWGNALCRIRNSIFHFAGPKVFRQTAARWAELADIIIGDRAGASRYLIVDELQNEILWEPIGMGDPHLQRTLVNTVTETMSALSGFVNEMLVFYASQHSGAIVEERTEAIDPQVLWGTPLDTTGSDAAT